MTPEDLIGHLLDLLPPEERGAIQAEITVSRSLYLVVEKLRQRLTVLQIDQVHIQCPPELARETCAALRRFLAENPPA